LACLVSPRIALDTWAGTHGDRRRKGDQAEAERAEGDIGDVLGEIERAAVDVGIVTLAPELDSSLELIGWLTSRGHQVSLGHSAATYEQAGAAIAAGARRATHLFNRMPRIDHRAPGLAGAVLEAEEVAAELVCDGVHVHPAILRTAISAKRPSRVLAITDGTAVSGLPSGARGTLGGQAITARDSAAWLSDGTLAGSMATMDAVFRTLVERVGVTLVDAATMCSTTPAREMGMIGYGILAPDAPADFVILDANLRVVQTYIGGQLVYARGAHQP
jgi:N-acetylglucosamine-6-phosphate deacetylase